MKTQTKTEIRNNTAKATKLLRGIDNEAAAIAKDQAKLNARVANVQKSVTQVTSLLGGISNTALTAPATAAKPAPAKKAAKPAKPAKKVAAKPAAKPAKKVAAKKAAAKTAPKKAAAKAAPKKTAKPAVAKKVAAKPAAKTAAKPAAKPGERPPLKSLINGVLDGASNEWTPAAELYKQVTAKAGYYSRQSLYNALKDEKSYEKQGEGAAAKFRRVAGAAATAKPAPAGKTSDEEVDSFVDKSTANPATASAT